MDEQQNKMFKDKDVLFIPKNSDNDPVNHPSHYTQGGVECIDAIKSATVGLDGFAGFLCGNAIKYLWRHMHKGNPVQDLDKAKWFISKLRSQYESRSHHEV